MATAYLPPQGDEDQDTNAPSGDAVELSPITLVVPETLDRPLWKSLLLNVRDRAFPPNVPPVRLTSTPVDVITPVGRMLATPWYRTILSNIGDIVAPESLPPLVLESRPVDVGELVSDRMSRPWWSSLLHSVGDALSSENLPPLELESAPAEIEELIGDRMSKSWWRSLLRSLADAVSKDDQPPLELTSAPLNPGISSVGLVLPHWSSLLETPKLISPPAESIPSQVKVRELPLTPARPQVETPQKLVTAPETKKILPVPLAALQVDADELYPLVHQFQDSLARSRRREIVWVSFISIEAIVLLCRYLGLF
jgi:hypothetical protein